MPATNIKSGWFQTPTSTPTGVAKKIAVDNPYVSADEFLQTPEAMGLNITSSHALYTSGQLDKILLRASAMVNRICGRYFDTQTIDEQKTRFQVRPYNPQLVTVVLANSPYQVINSIYIQVLKWFIQVDVTAATGYLQDFPDYGYYKIVPMLSSSGMGTGSPIPAQILDRVPLGVLWTNYTFGFGTPQTGVVLTQGATDKIFQAAVGYRLWAPDQTIKVYAGGSEVSSSLYTIDYANGKVTFTNSQALAITADFITNESVPADIKYATILLTSYLIGQPIHNPLGANSYSIQTFSVSFGGKENPIMERVKEILEPYIYKSPKVL